MQEEKKLKNRLGKSLQILFLNDTIQEKSLQKELRIYDIFKAKILFQ